MTTALLKYISGVKWWFFRKLTINHPLLGQWPKKDRTENKLCAKNVNSINKCQAGSVKILGGESGHNFLLIGKLFVTLILLC